MLFKGCHVVNNKCRIMFHIDFKLVQFPIEWWVKHNSKTIINKMTAFHKAYLSKIQWKKLHQLHTLLSWSVWFCCVEKRSLKSQHRDNTLSLWKSTIFTDFLGGCFLKGCHVVNNSRKIMFNPSIDRELNKL